MSTYSIIKSKLGKKSVVDNKTGTPLAVGAAIGGIAGKIPFSYISDIGENPEKVGMVQAVCLLAVTFGTLIYTLLKDRIKTKRINNMATLLIIGATLGMISSFLGIGGDPIKLVVLYYFF